MSYLSDFVDEYRLITNQNIIPKTWLLPKQRDINRNIYDYVWTHPVETVEYLSDPGLTWYHRTTIYACFDLKYNSIKGDYIPLYLRRVSDISHVITDVKYRSNQYLIEFLFYLLRQLFYLYDMHMSDNDSPEIHQHFWELVQPILNTVNNIGIQHRYYLSHTIERFYAERFSAEQRV